MIAPDSPARSNDRIWARPRRPAGDPLDVHIRYRFTIGAQRELLSVSGGRRLLACRIADPYPERLRGECPGQHTDHPVLRLGRTLRRRDASLCPSGFVGGRRRCRTPLRAGCEQVKGCVDLASLHLTPTAAGRPSRTDARVAPGFGKPLGERHSGGRPRDRRRLFTTRQAEAKIGPGSSGRAERLAGSSCQVSSSPGRASMTAAVTSRMPGSELTPGGCCRPRC